MYLLPIYGISFLHQIQVNFHSQNGDELGAVRY